MMATARRLGIHLRAPKTEKLRVLVLGASSQGELRVGREQKRIRAAVFIVTAKAFAAAIKATDTPPLLVLLNACSTANQIHHLAAEVVPFAIGMADEIDDGDAINYAAQFYASVANGQSVYASHSAGQAALELAGLDDADLPTLVEYRVCGLDFLGCV